MPVSHGVSAGQESARLDRRYSSLNNRGEEAAMMTDSAARTAGLHAAERRLLTTMPLHAITSVYGEAGLRERLLAEIARFPAADRARAGDALALAWRLHASDQRQREPYANHLLRVSIRILSHYRVTDPDVTCAALLHDSVKDHAEDIAPGDGPPGAFRALGSQFGGRAAELVAAVTNPEYEPGRNEHQQYREHVATSLEASPWARVMGATRNPISGKARGIL
jgi:hypothetical protein